MAIIRLILIAHFVGDFILQSDWMAINKSKLWDAIALHVLVYAATLTAFIAIFSVDGTPFVWLAVNIGVHFVQDAITARINARLWQANQRHWFFVGIGADQLLHYLVMFTTAGWWLR